MNRGNGQVAFLNSDGRPLFEALGRYLEAQYHKGSVLVLCTNEERVAELDSGLWTFDAESFVPHGTQGDGDPNEQSVWISIGEPGDSRSRLILVDDAMPKDWQHYEKYAYLFDARDPEARDRARARWREWSDQGKQLAYWNFDGNEWSLMRQS